jgi:hypothetical protein
MTFWEWVGAILIILFMVFVWAFAVSQLIQLFAEEVAKKIRAGGKR